MMIETRPTELPPHRMWLNVAAAVMVLFASMTFFRVREYTDKSLDFQAAIKLLAIAGSLIIPAVAIIAGKMNLYHRVAFVWLAFLLSFVFSSTYAPMFQLSLAQSMGFVGCFLFCMWMTGQFGEADTVQLMVLIVGLVSILSLIVYFTNPQLGRMHAWLGSEFGENNRIRGIAGSPNGLGSMTSMALVMLLLYFRRWRPRVKLALLCTSVPIILCLVMTENRMSFLSLIVCGGLYVATKGNKAANLGFLLLIAATILLVILADPSAIFSALSRSGEASEITTGTGRSMIWQVVLEHIAQRPIFGHGYGSATSILPLDPRLFSVAAHCHNLYLEILFSGGVMSFSLFAAALAMTFYEAFRNKCLEPMLMLLFFLIRGFTEPSPFGNMPTFSGYAFFLAISFILMRSRAGDRVRAQLEAQSALRMRSQCQKNLRTGSRFA